MSDLKTLPWRDAKATQPPPNVRVLVNNDSGEIGLGCRTTGADWHTDHCGSIITHWLPLEAIPRPRSVIEERILDSVFRPLAPPEVWPPPPARKS